ncbi:hypothetical protein [Antrihabitans cavernicola]|uniref:Uncharacterized protein n=1 Tax=Antrihabitans cavernicola TaxID=2495913 RepID=A0A5A7SCG9_9NOCA|nr:hypothetical protein [Spelaeibacter cavernicola]KAA0022872.1 hypothetical protein FOY51_10165 [Spelaeibacter cavernicola]
MVGKFESSKDVVQELTESAAHRVGNIATIITSAVKDVTREIGDFVTDGIEMREAAQQAKVDHDGGGVDPIDDRGADPR